MADGTHSADREPATTKPAHLLIARRALAAFVTVAALAWAADAPSRLGFALYTEQFLALILGLCLAIAYLAPPGTLGDRAEEDRSGRAPRRSTARFAVDMVCAAVGFGASLWIAVAYPDLISRALTLPADILVLSAALLLLVLEGLRRTVGWTLTIVVLAILGYGLIGHLVDGPLQTREVSPERMLAYLALDANGLLGLTLNVAATVVVAFVFFGQLLLKSGGADFFNDLAIASMGRRRGGAAKISIVASGLFGSISGVVVSNIVATGVVTIRLMTRSGLSPRHAAAVEATASTGGQIVPPVMGAVAFLMADILQRPYAEIVIAALIPALLYYVALFVQTDLQAARDGVAPIDEALIPPLGRVLRAGWVYALPFGAIVAALFVFNLRPDTAALWGAIGALLVGFVFGYGGKRMTLRDLGAAFAQTGAAIVDIVLIAAAAGFIIGVLNVTGLGFGLTFTLVDLGGGNLLSLLLVAAGVCLVLGMGMPTVGVYLLLAVLVAPSLVETGVDPIAAHLFIFYLGMMSMVTPPVAIGAFFAASIAKASPMRTALSAMRLGWTAYIVPFLFVAWPALLLNGPWWEVAWAVGAATLGVYAVSVAFVGHTGGRALSGGLRGVAALLGAVLLTPPAVAGDATAMLHAAAAVVVVAFAVLARRRDAAVPRAAE